MASRTEHVSPMLEVSKTSSKELRDCLHLVISTCRELQGRLGKQDFTFGECAALHEKAASDIKQLSKDLDTIVPQFRPIDIQTTYAGPGVGTAAKIVRLRLAEHFLIQDLDLLARFHYALRDSKTHKVQQVMSYLNEAVGDGRYIDILSTSVLHSLTNDQILTANDYIRL